METSELKKWLEQKIDKLKNEKVLRDDSNYIFDLLHKDMVEPIEPGDYVFGLFDIVYDYGSSFLSYLWDSVDLNEIQSMIDEDEVNEDWWNKCFADEEPEGEEKAKYYYIDAIIHYTNNFFYSEWEKDFGTDPYVDEIVAE